MAKAKRMILVRACVGLGIFLGIADPGRAEDPPETKNPIAKEDAFQAGTEWTGIYGSTTVNPRTREVIRRSTDARLVVTARDGERFWGEIWVNSGLGGAEIQGKIGTKGREKGQVQFTLTKLLTTTQPNGLVGNLKAAGKLNGDILTGTTRVSQQPSEGKFSLQMKQER